MPNLGRPWLANDGLAHDNLALYKYFIDKYQKSLQCGEKQNSEEKITEKIKRAKKKKQRKFGVNDYYSAGIDWSIIFVESCVSKIVTLLN